MKKIGSTLLILVLLCTMLSTFALSAAAATSGFTGACTWSLDGTVLTISGNGAMGDGRSWGNSITEVKIESGVTTIGNYAFSGCSDLLSITIPNSVSSIGYNAFYDCTSLSGVYITDLAAWCNINFKFEYEDVDWGRRICYSNPLWYAKKLYLNNELVCDLLIPNNVTRITGYAFEGCTSLTSVTIPDSVTSIGLNAFYGCFIKSLYISDLVSWCNIEFQSYFDDYYANPLTVGTKLYVNNILTTDLVIPPDVTKIPRGAFVRAYFKSITIPDSVTKIGWDSFILSNIETLTVPYADVSSGICGQNSNRAKIKNLVLTKSSSVEGFADHSELESIVICNGTSSIQSQAFYNCSALNSIALPDSITSIGANAFKNTGYYNNSNNWESGVLYIGSHLIEGKNNLVGSYEIKDGTITVAQNAFSNCSGLSSISIPKSVVTIGNSVFNNCSQLTDVYYAGTKEEWNNIFIGTENDPLLKAKVHFAEHTYTNACDTACDVCGAAREIVHSFGEYVYNNDATMEADGTRTRSCTVCGHSETVTAPGTLIVLSNPFTDVKAGVYYEKTVLWAVNKGITNGMGNGQFKPNETCTRGQIVTFLWRANGCPEAQSAVNPFSDVAENAYYTKAVLWAVEQGITKGTGDGKFSPAAECIREQIVTFLWRSQGQPVMGSANPFSDVATGTYYYDAVLWAVEKGITKGTSATTFAPKDDCTRGQIVTFLYRCLG